MTYDKSNGQAKAVGIWIRVSTEDQARGESPEHHEKRAQYYAESKGWDVKEVYHLEAVSGKSVKDHPEARRMMGDIDSGRITGLIFSKLARLARNTKELLEFADFFQEHGADLISLQEAIDTSTAAGRFFYTMIAAMAQWEREEIADRVAASVPIRAKLGKPLGGEAPYGYRYVDKKLVLDPKEAPIRRQMFELFREHKRKRRICRLLNEAGYRTRKGNKWAFSTVYRLLRDPIAKGVRRSNYSTRGGKHGEKQVLKPESEWVYTEAPAVVSEELWNECNRILDEQITTNRPPTKVVAHLFTSIVFCGCGGKMYVPSNSPKYICGKCRNKVGEADLEDIFREQLKSFVFSESDVRSYFEQADTAMKEKEALLATLTGEKAKVQADMDKVMQLYLKGEIKPEGFSRHYQPYEERYRQITDQIPEVQAEIDFLRIQYLSSDELVNEARDLYSRWPDLEPAEKRRIIETITERITVAKDDINITLSYLPTSELMAEGHQTLPVAGLSARTLFHSRPRSHAGRKSLFLLS